jgi:DNA-directed RNA polymerase subunit M/transcription elongation factor TFIIS
MEKLCDNCNNMMNIKIKDTDTLVLDCPSCNHVKPWMGSSCIYETNYTVDLSKIINSNVNISQDNTLPSIKDNPNIKCINKNCESSKSNILFIKYDQDNMKFMYICKSCGVSWTNTE